MLVLQSPKKKLGNLFKIIMNNQAAYEKAVTAVQRTLDPHLKDFPTEEYLSFSLKEDAVLTPVLICPACELIDTSQDSGNAYIGLFVNAVYQIMKKPQNIRGTLLPALKALSDGSKFDILLSLMTSPKYNLELAEALNLTAATVSHHMNVLLTYPLVSVEKREGRVYYTLSKDTIEKGAFGSLYNLIDTNVPSAASTWTISRPLFSFRTSRHSPSIILIDSLVIRQL
jgi:DNA-binding transcriptional ArsR family regulator